MNKSVIWRQCSVLMACVILPAGLAMAQSDGALDITGQLGATTDQSTSPPSISAPDSISDIVEDTPLFSLDTVTADSETDTDKNILSATSRDVPSVSLSNKDPKGVMLATIGINTEARGVLSRTMWQNSTVSDVMALMERLPERVSSPHLDQLLRHVMISRAIPPGGATQNAGIFVEYKL